MKNYIPLFMLAAALNACHSDKNELAIEEAQRKDSVAQTPSNEEFKYFSEQFADLRVLRYQVKDFDKLDLKTKTLLYYLSEAALSGRDINYDQNYKYNLAVRKCLEAILAEDHGAGEEHEKLVTYAKRVWFSNGIHHH